MGKLYDKRDLAFDLGRIDTLEQQLHKKIANGVLSAFVLSTPLESFDSNGKLVVVTVRDSFDKERQSCRMRLLQSGQLIRDLRYALGCFNRCPRCHMNEKGQRKWCESHYKMRFILRRIHDAVEENKALRALQGRSDDEEELHSTELSKWESWYWSDRREGIWPGSKAYSGTQSDLEKLKEDWGSLDYSGWLRMLLANEEIPQAEFNSEQARYAQQ